MCVLKQKMRKSDKRRMSLAASLKISPKSVNSLVNYEVNDTMRADVSLVIHCR